MRKAVKRKRAAKKAVKRSPGKGSFTRQSLSEVDIPVGEMMRYLTIALRELGDRDEDRIDWLKAAANKAGYHIQRELDSTEKERRDWACQMVLQLYGIRQKLRALECDYIESLTEAQVSLELGKLQAGADANTGTAGVSAEMALLIQTPGIMAGVIQEACRNPQFTAMLREAGKKKG